MHLSIDFDLWHDYVVIAFALLAVLLSQSGHVLSQRRDLRQRLVSEGAPLVLRDLAHARVEAHHSWGTLLLIFWATLQKLAQYRLDLLMQEHVFHQCVLALGLDEACKYLVELDLGVL